MTGDSYADELDDIESDHVPVLLRCTNRASKTRSQTAPPSRLAWRLERLRDPDICDAYCKKVEELAAQSSWFHSNTRNDPLRGDQVACDSALQECMKIFTAAALEVIGTRWIRPGYTARHMTAATKAAIDQRLEAHLRYKLSPTPLHRQAFDQARQQAKAAAKTARQDRRREATQKCVDAWRRAPGSRGAHHALKSLTGARTASDIDALQDPASSEVKFDDPGKAEALRTWYAGLFTSTQPAHAYGKEQASRSKEAVQAEWDTQLEGPEALAKQATSAEVQVSLSRMSNHRAPGADGAPVELFKYAGAAGASALAKLYNTVLATECTPTQWRQGLIVSAHKSGDPTQCGNYRGLTLLTAADKLFAAIISRRVGNHVSLHDHQYGFRPRRGTSNALFNLATVVRTRKAQGLGTYVFFLDAKKAFDTVPHHALLARLRAKGVTGKLWRIIANMYGSAACRVRVGTAVSQSFPVERGVAQGCPLSPLLYNIFADSLLDVIHQDNADDGIQIPGSQGHDPCSLVGQSYADDMAGIASTAAGLQRIICRVKAHSEEWEWEANTKKSVVMVFGNKTTLQAEQESTWHWGGTELTRVQEMKYLGLYFSQSGDWRTQIAAAATKGHQTLGQWLPVLANPRLSVSLKRRVIMTHIVPTLTYGMDVWGPNHGIQGRPASLQPLSDVIDKACRVAMGLHATTGSKAWSKYTSVCKSVLQSDFRLLPPLLQVELAHARLCKRSLPNDKRVFPSGEHVELEDAIASSAYMAPDHLGALLRANLPADDPWLRRCGNLAYAEEHGSRPTPLLERAHRQASIHRRRIEAAAPDPDLRGRNLRPSQAGPHYNPVQHVLRQEDPPAYLCRPSPATWPIMSLRSGRLPHMSPARAQELAGDADCSTCGAVRILPEGTQLSTTERVWRHVHHHLFVCPAHSALLQDLMHDLRCAAEASECEEMVTLLEEVAADGHSAQPQHGLLPLLLDPASYCAVFEARPGMAWLMQRLVAAFCLLAGSGIAVTDIDSQHIRCLHLPAHSRLLTRVFPLDFSPLQPYTDSFSESDDELVPHWVQSSPASPTVGPIVEPALASPHLAFESPDGAALPSTTQIACAMSGSEGLHEADAPSAG